MKPRRDHDKLRRPPRPASEPEPIEKISLEDLDAVAGGVFVPPKPS
jgi:hypothetical protein